MSEGVLICMGFQVVRLLSYTYGPACGPVWSSIVVLFTLQLFKDMRRAPSMSHTSAQRAGEQVTGVDSEGVTVKCKAVEGEHRVPGRTVVWVRSAILETGHNANGTPLDEAVDRWRHALSRCDF